MAKKYRNNRKPKKSVTGGALRNSRNLANNKLSAETSEDSDFSFDEAFKFSEGQFLNEDVSEPEEASVNTLLAQRIKASLLEELEDQDILEFSDDDFSDSADDCEEDELWEIIKELTLNDKNKPATRQEMEASLQKNSSTAQSAESKKKSGKNISSEENILRTEKIKGKENLKPPRKSKLKLKEELSMYEPMGVMSSKDETRSSTGSKKAKNKKKNVFESPESSKKQYHWREANSLIASDSDSEDTETDLSSSEDDSDYVSNSRGKSTKALKSVDPSAQTPKSKTQVRKERREEKKAKRKEKRERNRLLHNQSVNLYSIDRTIRDFVKHSTMAAIPFQHMDRGKRRAVHLLAKEYNISSKSKGSGDKKYPILYRTQRTAIPANLNGIRQILENSGSIPRKTKSPYDLIKSEKRDKGRPKDKSTTPSRASRAYDPNSPVPPVGSIVGQYAKPIEESNIGHQMLQKMGWLPGQSLASSSSPGRTTPVEAIVRGKSRIGLGGAL